MTSTEIAAEIKREINDDPTIDGARHIYVFTSKKGIWPFRRSEIHMSGDVHKESDKNKAMEHAKHAAGDTPVFNDIIISPPR